MESDWPRDEQVSLYHSCLYNDFEAPAVVAYEQLVNNKLTQAISDTLRLEEKIHRIEAELKLYEKEEEEIEDEDSLQFEGEGDSDLEEEAMEEPQLREVTDNGQAS